MILAWIGIKSIEIGMNRLVSAQISTYRHKSKKKKKRLNRHVRGVLPCCYESGVGAVDLELHPCFLELLNTKSTIVLSLNIYIYIYIYI